MRRNNQAVLSAMGHHPPNPQASWTVVTPNSRISPGLGPHLPSSAKPSRHPSDIYYPAYQHPTLAVPMAPTTTPVGPSTSQSVVSDASSVRERGNRYSPYHGHRNRTPSVPYSTALSLDIPSLARHEHAPSHYRSGAADTEVIRLPPIQPPPHFQGASQASYALPPISALEDLRGIHSCDSAAVLRRLQANDDVGSETGRTAEGQVWTRGRSLSAPPQKSELLIDSRFHVLNELCVYIYICRHPSVDAPLSSWSPKSAASPRLRTLTGYKFMRPSFSSQPSPHPHISVVFPSEPCGDGNSTCDPSPISPATPRSAVSSTNDSHHFSRVPLALNKHGQTTPQGYASVSHEWPKGRGDMYVQQQQQQRHEGVFRGRETRLSASGCRNSYGEDSDNDSMHPVRPW
jgi:hypothetical protein